MARQVNETFQLPWVYKTVTVRRNRPSEVKGLPITLKMKKWNSSLVSDKAGFSALPTLIYQKYWVIERMAAMQKRRCSILQG